MHKRFFLATAMALVALAPALLPAQAAVAADKAAGVTRLGGSGGWDAYLDQGANGKICFLIGKPKRVEGGRAKQDEVRMSVTHRPRDHAENVVNFILGFRAKKDSDAALEVDGRKFALFTDKDGAWARDSATDRAVVMAMMRGKSATIKAEPEHGKPGIDSYDLAGFGGALTLIDKACGVRR
jgi:invasion protein IalB